MGAHLNELEHVEQELAELKNHLKQSFGVLDDLIKVQTQFEDVAQTYQKLKAYVDEARTIYTSLEAEARAILERISQAQETLNQNFAELKRTNEVEARAILERISQAQETLNQNFAELERANESKWGEFRSELSDVQNELYTAHRNLRTELSMQVNSLKGEIEKRLEEFSKSWEGYKRSVQASLSEFETRLTTEVETFKKSLEQIRIDTNQRFNRLHKWVIVAISIGLSALGLTVWLFFKR